jgi:secreted trypsin-like serine protease
VPIAVTLAVAAAVTTVGVAGAIIKGEEARDAPFVTRIRSTGGGHTYGCTGSVIDAQWVLTAAHCARDMESIDVYVGALEADRQTKIAATEWYLASGYDIAVLGLETEIPSASPVRLASATPPVGAASDVYGWGRTEQGTSPSELKTAQMKVSDLACPDAANGPAICATEVTGNGKCCAW